jgi:hypothetical protein
VLSRHMRVSPDRSYDHDYGGGGGSDSRAFSRVGVVTRGGGVRGGALLLALILSSRAYGVLKRGILSSTALNRLLLLSRKCGMICSPNALSRDTTRPTRSVAKSVVSFLRLLRRSSATMKIPRLRPPCFRLHVKK